MFFTVFTPLSHHMKHQFKLAAAPLFQFSLVIALLFSNASIAQTADQQSINQQDWIIRQQQNQLEEQRRAKEEETIEKERKRRKKEERENQKQIPISGAPAKCFPITSIALNGADSLSAKQQKKLTENFIGKCVEAKTLVEIISAIQSFYNEHGYVAAKVNVPKQNIQSGNLELKILEGKVGELIVGDDNFTDKMQQLTAFGALKGEVLNVGDINQGIYQMNRLQSNAATMKIEPANREGEANVYIANQRKFPARATVGYDNLGNDFTGVRRTNFSGGFDNLLFLNDAITFNYTTNLNDNSQEKDIRSFTSGISIPLGYNTLSYDFSRSEYRGTSRGNFVVRRITGFSQQNKVTIDRVLFYKGNTRLSISSSLTDKTAASYQGGVKTENSIRHLSIANFSLSLSDSFKNGTSIYLKPSYSRGLKILNAQQDQKNDRNTVAKSQFDVFKLYASISRRFTIPRLDLPVTLASEMDSQYAKQTLYGSEQFAVGGNYSVRGFRENYIVGDSGYYFRNKINVRLGDLLPMNWKVKKVDDNTAVGTKFLYLNNFAIEPFYDYGYVKNKFADKGADGRLSGYGVKTIFSSKFFNASLTYSEGLSKSRLITSKKTEDHLIYFEISASCCS